LVVAASLLFGACGTRGDTAKVDTADRIASAPISDSAVGPGTRAGAWQGADARSTWHAVLDGPWITQIDEIVLFTDSARSMRQFQFDSSGFLSKAREERVQTLYGQKAAPDTLHTLIELEWSRDSLARSAKRVNGAGRLLQPYEVDNLRAHADELRRLARTGTIPGTTETKR
jgi:hypothetical protein